MGIDRVNCSSAPPVDPIVVPLAMLSDVYAMSYSGFRKAKVAMSNWSFVNSKVFGLPFVVVWASRLQNAA